MGLLTSWDWRLQFGDGGEGPTSRDVPAQQLRLRGLELVQELWRLMA